MKKVVQNHSDKNIGKSMATYTLFERVSGKNFSSFDQFLSSKYTDSDDKKRLWKINQIIALVIVIENSLICSKNKEFKLLTSSSKSRIKNRIIKKIMFVYKVQKSEAVKILYKQTKGNDDRIFTPRILQAVAGFNLGELVDIVEAHFSNKVSLIKSLKKFKDDRNFVFHNSTSSTSDIDRRLDNAITSGQKIKDELQSSI